MTLSNYNNAIDFMATCWSGAIASDGEIVIVESMDAIVTNRSFFKNENPIKTGEADFSTFCDVAKASRKISFFSNGDNIITEFVFDEEQQ